MGAGSATARRRLPETWPACGLRSFEPADIVNEVMSFGSPTPVEVAVSGPNLADDRAFAEKLRDELAKIPSLARPAVRPVARLPDGRQSRSTASRPGLSGVTAADVARSWSCGHVVEPVRRAQYWPDPKTGIGYQVQVEIPYQMMDSLEQIETVPIQSTGSDGQLLLRDVAEVREGTMPGEYDRYNMKRPVSLTANIAGEDLGRVAGRVERAIRRAGDPPEGCDGRRPRPDRADGADVPRPGASAWRWRSSSSCCC